MGKMLLELSKVSDASAMFIGALDWDPLKTTPIICGERREFALCSPRHHLMASTTFDFPHPLGPTTADICLSKVSWVLSAKDLKPHNSTDFKYMLLTTSRNYEIYNNRAAFHVLL